MQNKREQRRGENLSKDFTSHTVGGGGGGSGCELCVDGIVLG